MEQVYQDLSDSKCLSRKTLIEKSKIGFIDKGKLILSVYLNENIVIDVSIN